MFVVLSGCSRLRMYVFCCLFVIVSGYLAEQGGVAFIQDTGTFSAEQCSFTENTADVRPALWA